MAAGLVRKATDAAIRSARAGKRLTAMDNGTVSVLRHLADAIDAFDEDGLNPAGKLDNVTIPTYLKYAKELGLTPIGRAQLDAARARSQESKKIAAAKAAAAASEVSSRPAEPPKRARKLASVSDIPRPAG